MKPVARYSHAVHRWLVFLASVALLGGIAAGCAAEPETAAFLVRTIPEAPPEQVFQAAELILRREFGRVSADPRQRSIVSQPVEFTATQDSGSARDLVGARSNMRRTAMFTVAPSGTGTLARVRVDVERQDTHRRTAVQPEGESRLSDSPAYTPIERDAATTERQNQVWTKVRRDRALERSILDELESQFAAEGKPKPRASSNAADSAADPAAE